MERVVLWSQDVMARVVLLSQGCNGKGGVMVPRM